MATYKPFLIQKLKPNSPVRDSQEWNIYVKSVPFKVFPSVKEPFKRSWLDEHGDDEYITDNPFYEAYELACSFVYIGNHGTANEYIQSFLKYLAEGGMFSMYDTYTGIGRTNVRYIQYDEDVLYRRDEENDIVVFSVKLKVNDPITDVKLEAEEALERWLRFVSDNGGDVQDSLDRYNSLHPLIKSEAKTILYPSVIGESTVYGVDRRFGNPVKFNFSRFSQGTYFDKNQELQLSPVNTPRVDYGNYGSSAKILIEKAGTNIVKKSGEKLDISTPTVNYNLRTYKIDPSNLITGDMGVLTLNISVFEGFTSRMWFLDINTWEFKTGNTETIIVDKSIKAGANLISKGSTTIYNYDYNSSNEQRLSNKFIINWIDIKKGTERTSYIPTPTDASATRTEESLTTILTKKCSVYLKTTKINTVLDVDSGEWDIAKELNNDGIITLAIFDRILTATEKAQLTA